MNKMINNSKILIKLNINNSKMNINQSQIRQNNSNNNLYKNSNNKNNNNNNKNTNYNINKSHIQQIINNNSTDYIHLYILSIP